MSESAKDYLTQGLPEVEQTNLDAYQNTSDKFSGTRYKIWPSTLRYLENVERAGIEKGDRQTVLEVGCGNGKNFTHEFDHISFEGTDICPNLLQICKDREFKVTLCDGCDLPFNDNSFDHVFSVAVIHHLSTLERREKFLSEMVRVCKPGGRIMFQVWSTTSPKFDTSLLVEGGDLNDRYVLFKIVKDGELDESNRRFYHFFDEEEFGALVSTVALTGEYSHERNNHIFEGVVAK